MLLGLRSDGAEWPLKTFTTKNFVRKFVLLMCSVSSNVLYSPIMCSVPAYLYLSYYVVHPIYLLTIKLLSYIKKFRFRRIKVPGSKTHSRRPSPRSIPNRTDLRRTVFWCIGSVWFSSGGYNFFHQTRFQFPRT